MRKCFGTMVMTKNYLLGAKFLKEGLERVNSIYDFILFIPKNMFSENELISLGFSEWYYFDLVLYEGNSQEITINKIEILRALPKNIKLCLLDADIQIMGNLDHYLDYPVGSAYFTSMNHITGECIIFEHNIELYQEMLQFIEDNVIENDEDIWNKKYIHFNQEVNKHFPMSEKYQAISHIVGGLKYWMHDIIYKIQLSDSKKILYIPHADNSNVKLYFNFDRDHPDVSFEILDIIYPKKIFNF